jgi:7,8-dihydropterin-6-yl-methyl-4-(beta-D-ribofuranosyl)aminobenzene 5'-phosphate synthase
MKITCLVDNGVRQGTSLWGEHGLAFLIETESGRILFDAGQSGDVLLHNLRTLAIEPRTIDALAVSHGHYDHTGGLAAILAHIPDRILLYAHPDLFRERFSRRDGEIRSIGLSLDRQALEAGADLLLDIRPQEIVPGIWTTGEIAARPAPGGTSARHLVRDNGGWAPDPYRDDMALVVDVGDGLVLVCGCCHAGLLNTLDHVDCAFQRPVVGIVGGTHLISADSDHLRYVIERLMDLGTVRHIHPNHCSGPIAFHALLAAFGADVVHACPAGSELDLEAFL